MQKQLELLKKYTLTVEGVRGQHFLIDPNIQRKIVACVNPKPSDLVLEIGPGLGALTEELLHSGAQIVAVESDRRFCEILKTEYGSQFKNLNVIHADILSIQLDQLFPKNKHAKLKVVGNLPYYITSPIIFCLVSHRKLIQEAVLMMQKEIVDRLLAKTGSKNYSRLSLLAQYYFDIERAFNVPRTCFSPKPRVNSSVVKLIFRKSDSNVDETLLFQIIKYTFAHRRKNILNSLSHELKNQYSKETVEKALSKAGLDPKKRAEDLSMKDYLKLTEAFRKCCI